MPKSKERGAGAEQATDALTNDTTKINREVEEIFARIDELRCDLEKDIGVIGSVGIDDAVINVGSCKQGAQDTSENDPEEKNFNPLERVQGSDAEEAIRIPISDNWNLLKQTVSESEGALLKKDAVFCRNNFRIKSLQSLDTTDCIAGSVLKVSAAIGEEAIRRCEQELEQYRSNPESEENNIEIFCCLNRLGDLLYYNKDHAKAIECYTQIFSVYEQIERLTPENLANTHSRLGSAHQALAGRCFNQREYGDAATHYAEAILRYRKSQFEGNLPKLLECYDKLGDSYYNQGVALFDEEKYTEAKTHYSKAIDAYQASSTEEDATDVVYCLVGMGHVCFKQRNYAEAAEYYNKAIGTKEAQTDLELLSICYRSLQKAYNIQGLTEEVSGIDAILSAIRVSEKSESTEIVFGGVTTGDVRMDGVNTTGDTGEIEGAFSRADH